MKNFLTFLCGLVFGAGLLISGMANPAKVLNFLDVAGSWDPSLALVMAAAVGVTALGYALVFRGGEPAMDSTFHVPDSKVIGPRLLSGAALFGIGWGLAGFCPGPAIVAIPFLNAGTLIFVAAMLAGMFIARRLPS